MMKLTTTVHDEHGIPVAGCDGDAIAIIRDLLRLVPGKGSHDTACSMHSMHDDLYENPEPNEHPQYPRRCECHVEIAARAQRMVGG